MKTILVFLTLSFFSFLQSCNAQSEPKTYDTMDVNAQNEQNLSSIVLGAGCFWCTEAVFNRVQGIVQVEVGYSGGELENPSYKQVVSGTTGHVEVAKVFFDPEVISLEDVLEIFWHTHDPTTLNRQGADVGTQYRSVIFYANEQQKAIAESSLAKTDASDLWSDPIVTAVESLKNYYPAEDYHQEYYEFNKSAGYCNYVIRPKLQKLFKSFANRLKEGADY